MVKRVDFIPVASELSDPVRNKEVVDKFLRGINTSRLRIHDVITDISGLSDSLLGGLRSVIIYVVTGGSEELIAELAGKARFSIILAHKGMNSLPAAIEAKSLLNYLGISSLLLRDNDPVVIDEALKSLYALNDFPERIMLVGKPSPWLIYGSRVEVFDFLRNSLGVEIISTGLEELISVYNSIDEGLVSQSIPDEFMGRAGKDIDLGDLTKAYRLYLALRKLLNSLRVRAFSIRCFDLIGELGTTACLPLALLNSEGYIAGCEGDLSALISMIIGTEISGPSFMGNLVWLSDDEVILAHCTAPLSLVSDYALTTHYESGIGVGVRGYLRKGSEVTLFKLDPLTMDAKILEGVVVGSGEIVKEGCRSQFRVKVLKGNAEVLIGNPSGNHYVLIRGHHGKELRYVANLLGLTDNYHI